MSGHREYIHMRLIMHFFSLYFCCYINVHFDFSSVSLEGIHTLHYPKARHVYTISRTKINIFLSTTLLTK